MRTLWFELGRRRSATEVDAANWALDTIPIVKTTVGIQTVTDAKGPTEGGRDDRVVQPNPCADR